MKSGLPCGIEYNENISQYVFHICTYFEHFKNAVNDYIRGLENGTEKLSCIEEALKNKAELVQLVRSSLPENVGGMAYTTVPWKSGWYDNTSNLYPTYTDLNISLYFIQLSYSNYSPQHISSVRLPAEVPQPRPTIDDVPVTLSILQEYYGILVLFHLIELCV